MATKRKPGRPGKKARAPAGRGRRRGTRTVEPSPRAPAPPLDDFVAAAADALAIPIKPEWLSAITANLEVNLRMGALVAEFALPDESAPAPVFEA
jgi:hypothetical protein